MSGNRNYAWVVLVPKDDSKEAAILSGKFLRKTNTTFGIVALVSTCVSKETICQLNAAFDAVVVRDMDNLHLENGFSRVNGNGLLMMSGMGLRIFTKAILLSAGVLFFRQADDLFDDDRLGQDKNSVMEESEMDWRIVRIQPDTRDRKGQIEKMNLKGCHEQLGSCKELSCMRHWRHEIDRCDCSIAFVNEVFARKLLNEVENEDDWELLGNVGEDDTKDWVAIVGMSCRFPEANNLEEYWDILSKGMNTSRLPPQHRLSLVEMDPGIRANFLKCPIDQFDANFFGISPSEAVFTDPQVRLLLEGSYEAFENAGISPETLRGSKTGVFYGSWLQEYKEALTENSGGASNQDFLRKYIGNAFGCSAAKLSYFYGFTGPNVSTESGCSSSMVAVDMAVKSLQRRECPVALACGVNVILSMSKQTKLWAEDGRCKTFDLGADGYARAEGAAILILKRYSDAIRDGDRVHGVIRGSATSQEGLSKSFGTPTVDSEYNAMTGALNAAGLDPSDVDYLEAHATGTAVGDPIEAAAIVKAYSSNKGRQEPLWIGSGKTNIGHSESCSGMAGIIKVILAMEHEVIPPHINLTSVNPQVDFSPIPGSIPVQGGLWPKKNNRRRIAGVSSFGITGTDAHIIIQEPPTQLEKKHRLPELENDDKQKNLILTLSAKSEVALDQLTDLFRDHLETSEDPIEDIAFTANACRPHHLIRRAVIASNKNDLLSKLKSGHKTSSTQDLRTKQHDASKICFTFPGRIGSMSLTPIRDLYESVPYFRKTMDECDAIFKKVIGSQISLVSILFSPEECPSHEWYTLLPTCQYSLTKLWIHWGITPSSVMGHCFGEISAAIVCGALKLEDAYRLTTVIPNLFECQRQNPATMLAVNAGRDTVQELINLFFQNNNSSGWIDMACVNSPTQTVVVTPPEMVQAFKKLCQAQGIRSKVVTMDFCAHSRAVEQGLAKSLKILNELTHHPIQIPYVSSATGKLVQNSDLNGMYWYKVIRNCVNFIDACQTARREGLGGIFLELGLDGSLTNFTKQNFSSEAYVCIPTFGKGLDAKIVLGSVAELYTSGVNFNWQNFYDKNRQRVTLPHYPFQRKSFWFEKRHDTRSGVRAMARYSQTLHPLLGTRMESPAGLDNMVIFQNDLISGLLEEEQSGFIRDHVISTKVIYPGACFLEMIMSAWKHHASVKDDAVLAIKDFFIHSPLVVDHSYPKRVQCVVNTESQMVSIYSSVAPSNEGKASPWTLHASANVGTRDDELDIGNIFESIKINGVQPDDYEATNVAQNFYVSASEVGLKFGENFKSLKRVHSLKNEDTLAEVGWKNDNSGLFFCHPILIDAMVQAWMVHKKPDLKRLHVPVKIGKFVMIQSYNVAEVTEERKWYVYCKHDESVVSLVDQEGIVVAVMMKLELVATSVDSVLSAAGCQVEASSQIDKSAIKLYNEDWKKSRFHQSIGSVHSFGLEGASSRLKDLEKSLNALNEFSSEEEALDKIMNRLCYLYVVKGLFEMGWQPKDVSVDKLQHEYLKFVKIWGIVPGLVPAFKFYLSYLGDNEAVDSLEQVEKEIEDLLKVSPVKEYAAMETIHECGTNLSGILKGSVSPHKILFDKRNLADVYYQTTRFRGIVNPAEQLFTQLMTSESYGNGVLRILEIGGGTGVFPKRCVPVLKKLGIKYEYHFTDISPTLVSKATELFSEEEKESFIFKLLNIEVDSLQQGFAPGYFDIVVALDVLHATTNLNHTLRNIQLVTKVGGRIFLGETEKPIREVDICFGILDGYWKFEDGIRKEHCTLGCDQWLELLGRHGFTEDTVKILSCGGQMSLISGRKTKGNIPVESNDGLAAKKWLVFHFGSKKLQNFKDYLETSTGRAVDTVSMDADVNLKNDHLEKFMSECVKSCHGNLEGIIFWILGENDHVDTDKSTVNDGLPNPRKVLEPFLCIVKVLTKSKLKVLPRFHVITEGCWAQPDKSISRSTPNHSYTMAMAWGFLRNLRIELPGIISKSIDLSPETPTVEMLRQLGNEIFLDDKETEVIFQDGIRHVRRLKEGMGETPTLVELSIPGEGQYEISLPKSKVISDVKFIESVSEISDLGKHEVLVDIFSVSLNFKDVLAVMKPSADFEQLTSLGLDFAGVVSGAGTGKWKVGDVVFGCAWEQGCMKSRIKTHENALISVPQNITYAEAATLPAVFLTAWHCMVNVAKLTAGKTILVHAASGGVGLVAIQIAKLLGATVIGTAGNDRKRNYVRSHGVKHVFNSRTLEFKNQVLAVTNGEGVDMVLNCLTGPGFKEASLEVCRDSGHFVEISKLDIWSVNEIKQRRSFVKYDIVDVTQVDTKIIQEMMETLAIYLEDGRIKPLPYTSFPASRLVDALSYLQKAKQIGKVIVNMPRRNYEGQRQELLFNERSSYLITGGMGAIGIAVCRWMLTQGAKYVVIVGRSEPKEAIKQIINELKIKYDANVICKQLDVSDYSQVEKLVLEDIAQEHLPPLKGIHHCAGIISDKLIIHQDWANFDNVLRPKVDGAWNLHKATRNVSLEHFVLYSSAAATFGNAGQSNYVAANAYLDSLAQFRQSINLPALSINWGLWEVGLGENVKVEWLHPFSIDEGIANLEVIMKNQHINRGNIIAGKFHFSHLLVTTPYFRKTFLESMDTSSSKKETPTINITKDSASENEPSLCERHRILEDPTEKKKLVRKFILRILCDTLGTSEDEIRDDIEFSEMGMDSLMSIEFTNKLYAGMDDATGSGSMGVAGNSIDLDENGTLNKLTELISSILAKLS